MGLSNGEGFHIENWPLVFGLWPLVFIGKIKLLPRKTEDQSPKANLQSEILNLKFLTVSLLF
jgi:hypothetical protein